MFSYQKYLENEKPAITRHLRASVYGVEHVDVELRGYANELRKLRLVQQKVLQNKTNKKLLKVNCSTTNSY